MTLDQDENGNYLIFVALKKEEGSDDHGKRTYSLEALIVLPKSEEARKKEVKIKVE